MTRPDDELDARIARVLAASRATSEAAVVARARARIAEPAAPGWIAWLSRPSGVAACAALLIVAVVWGGVMAREGAAAASDTGASSIVSDLVGDRGDLGIALPSDATTDAGSDTGTVAR